MYPLHPAFRSDIFLLQMDGAVISDRGEYLVVQFHRNPDFIWGNFLFLKAPPLLNDLHKWIDVSKRELGSTWYMSFGWDGLVCDNDELAPYLEFGFEFEQSDVLLCHTPIKPTKYSELKLVACRSDEDWERVLETHKFLFARGKFKDSQLEFFTKRFQSFRRMAESSYGEFFEAWLGDEIVGSFGIYYYNDEARFQEVVVYPKFRNLGIAQSMCFAGMEFAFREWQVAKVLTVAELPEALSCYKNIGFQAIGIQEGLKWVDLRIYPKED